MHRYKKKKFKNHPIIKINYKKKKKLIVINIV